MVSNLVKRGIDAFVSRQTNIFTAASFIILTTILSQFLGVLKYRLLVSLFGASSDLGVFLAAFRIPDFIFQVFIAGALSASFIPIFADFLNANKKREAFEFLQWCQGVWKCFSACRAFAKVRGWVQILLGAFY